MAVIRRELKKMAEGVKIDPSEVEQIIRMEVLKRELVEGEEAEAAQNIVNKVYRKSIPRRKPNKDKKETSQKPEGESVTERLLRDSQEGGVEQPAPDRGGRITEAD